MSDNGEENDLIHILEAKHHHDEDEDTRIMQEALKVLKEEMEKDEEEIKVLKDKQVRDSEVKLTDLCWRFIS